MVVLCPVRCPEETLNPEEEDCLVKGTAEHWPGALESVGFIFFGSLSCWVVPGKSLQPLCASLVALLYTNTEKLALVFSEKSLSNHIRKKVCIRMPSKDSGRLSCPSTVCIAYPGP